MRVNSRKKHYFGTGTKKGLTNTTIEFLESIEKKKNWNETKSFDISSIQGPSNPSEILNGHKEGQQKKYKATRTEFIK